MSRVVESFSPRALRLAYYLVALDEHGRNVDRTCEHLNRKRRAIIENLKELGELLGEPVYTPAVQGKRSTHLTITPFGEHIIERAGPHVWKACQQLDGARKEFGVEALRVGSTLSGLGREIPLILEEWRREYPDVPIRVLQGNDVRLKVMLEANEVDFIIAHIDAAGPAIARVDETFKGSRTVLALPPGTPPPVTAYINAAKTESKRVRFVDRETGWILPLNSTRVASYLEQGKLNNVLMTVGHYPEVLELVDAGLGATICSAHLLKRFPKTEAASRVLNGDFVDVTIFGASNQFEGTLMYRAKNKDSLKDYQQHFIEVFKKKLPDLRASS